MAPNLLSRRDNAFGTSSAASSSGGLPTLAIAGFVVVGLIALAGCGWVGLRFYRKRAQRLRADSRNAAFLSVKGLVRDRGEGDPEKAAENAGPQFGGQQFSRAALADGVVMPSRAHRPDATDDEIREFHASTTGVPKPFHFALAASSPTSPSRSTPEEGGGHSPQASHGSRASISISIAAPEADRRSWRSSLFGGGLGGGGARASRASLLSVSARDSAGSSVSGGGARKVRQLFAPVLPDELVLALGESLTVVHSYDDGWCIVGRESSLFAAAAAAAAGSNAFGTKHTAPADKAEMGAVPAWVFVKPVKGLRAERPMRSSSLGVTVDLEAPGAPWSSRQECVSWSNF